MSVLQSIFSFDVEFQMDITHNIFVLAQLSIQESTMH
jgi:hypothetical protein